MNMVYFSLFGVAGLVIVVMVANVSKRWGMPILLACSVLVGEAWVIVSSLSFSIKETSVVGVVLLAVLALVASHKPKAPSETKAVFVRYTFHQVSK
jgi:hypothetical protein